MGPGREGGQHCQDEEFGDVRSRGSEGRRSWKEQLWIYKNSKDVMDLNV